MQRKTIRSRETLETTLKDEITRGVCDSNVRKLLRQAQKTMAEARHEQAYKFIQQAVKIDPELPLAAHDMRACCLMKMGSLDKAASDACLMIKRAPDQALGYQRLIRIQLVQKNREKALRAYNRACEALNPAARKAFIQYCDNQFSKRLHGMRRDPLKALPAEVSLLMLGHLTFELRLQAMRVCKNWRDMIVSYPCFWSNLSLCNKSKSPSATVIKAYARRAKGECKRLSLPDPRINSDSLLMAVLMYNDTVQELIWSSLNLSRVTNPCSRFLRQLCSLTLTGPLEVIDFIRCLNWCSLLKTFKVQRLTYSSSRRTYAPITDSEEDSPIGLLAPRLENLDITGEESPILAESDALWFRNLLPSLQHLSVSNPRAMQIPLSTEPSRLDLCRDLPRLRSLRLSCLRATFDSIPPTLQHLDIGGETGYFTLGETFTFPLPQSFALRFRNIVGPARVVEFLLRHAAPSLRECGMTGQCAGRTAADVEPLTSDAILQMIQQDYFNNCIHLDWSRSLINDTCVSALVLRARQLQTVKLSETEITGVGVRTLVMQLGALKKLDLSECRKVNVDAVTWARTQGIQVTFKLAAW